MSSSKVGKVVINKTTLKELRFLLCPSGKGSEGARAFIRSNYNILKKQIPETPVLVRESEGIEPMLFARFENGREQQVPLKGLDPPAIIEKVKEIIIVKDGEEKK